MEAIVSEVLRKSSESEAKYKSTDVAKELEVDIDIGNLLVSDGNVLDLKEYKSNVEEFIKSLARDNTQLLVNKIWQLPVETVDDVIAAKIPAPTTVLPREKPIPKSKPLTKWEQYVKDKGITKRPKAKLVWDEVVKDWKPRYGFRRGNDNTKDWLIEVSDKADPYEDQFEKRKKAKKERVAKNELQRLRNIARSHKMKVPGVGLTPTEITKPNEAAKALAFAKKATASVGKFADTLPNEKPNRKMGLRRKFEPLLGNMDKEKKKNMAIFDKMSAKKPKLDVKKAMNVQMREENQRRSRVNKKLGNKRKK